MVIRIGDAEHKATVIWRGGADFHVETGGESHAFEEMCTGEAEAVWRSDGATHRALHASDGSRLLIQTGTCDFAAEETTYADRTAAAAGSSGAVVSPMNGRVLRIEVAVGDAVKKGQLVAVLEAMKMEHEITAGADGKVTEVPVTAGQQVGSNALLAQIETGEG